jgi:serine/threonine protein kinase
MTLAVGQKLGPYEILSPIGEGGMGEVWKARDTRLDRFWRLRQQGRFVPPRAEMPRLWRSASALRRFTRTVLLRKAYLQARRRRPGTAHERSRC